MLQLTVKQFKEKIAETVSVSAEAQRLIYCGRVLQDDKKLSEYGENAMMISLGVFQKEKYLLLPHKHSFLALYHCMQNIFDVPTCNALWCNKLTNAHFVTYLIKEFRSICKT